MKKLLLTLLFFPSITFAGWIVQTDGAGRVTVRKAQRNISAASRVLRDLPEFLSEDRPASSGKYREVYYNDGHLPKSYRTLAAQCCEITSWPGSEVQTLVNQGPSANRIDLVIVGDGYTQAEKTRFFEDATRITNDLFGEKTFASYLPLFNVHAVFVPSTESGLTDLTRKNTALGLYRQPAGSKRGIMPGNTRAIERALALAPDVDYPILLANDEFYGGLGGRYAITTRSLESGKIVLRHELGHNFGEVGEEYDGGYTYSGANASHSLPLSWQHWIDGEIKTFESKQLTGDYVWQNLKDRPYKRTFNFPAGNYIFDSIVSAVGWSTKGDVSVLLNGQEQNLIGRFTQDRTFFTFHNTLSAGTHTVEAKENIQDLDNVLAFINVYALPADIIKDKGFIGAYATFDINGQKSYRPTFDTCIMREMTSEEFCSVDKENFWHKFLARIDLVDSLEIQNYQNKKEVIVSTPRLPGLVYEWSKYAKDRFVILPEQMGPRLTLPANESGEFRLRVRFITSEVRLYTPEFNDVRDFKL